MLNTIAAAAALLLAPQAELVKLDKVYKSGDTDTYAINARVTEDGGQEMEFKGRLVFKVLKDPKDGKTEVEMTTPVLTMTIGGANTDATAPDPLRTTLNKYGMPPELEVKDERWVYVLATLSGYLPAAETKVGGEFHIDWTSQSKAVTINGKGTLLKV